MRTLFLSLLAAVSAVHLYASYVNNKKLRALTKGPILLFLLGFYLVSSPEPDALVVAAILFSWLGDVLLIFKRGFAAGGISFLMSHVCFILVYSRAVDFASLPWWLLILPFLVYFAAVFFEFRALKGHIHRPLLLPMILYLCTNGTMNVFALWLHASKPCAASALVYIGALLFFISDCILFFVRFRKDKPVWRNHFPVMLAYISGEFLIIWGLLKLGM